jgi:hypothetical protein
VLVTSSLQHKTSMERRSEPLNKLKPRRSCVPDGAELQRAASHAQIPAGARTTPSTMPVAPAAARQGSQSLSSTQIGCFPLPSAQYLQQQQQPGQLATGAACLLLLSAHSSSAGNEDYIGMPLPPPMSQEMPPPFTGQELLPAPGSQSDLQPGSASANESPVLAAQGASAATGTWLTEGGIDSADVSPVAQPRVQWHPAAMAQSVWEAVAEEALTQHETAAAAACISAGERAWWDQGLGSSSNLIRSLTPEEEGLAEEMAAAAAAGWSGSLPAGCSASASPSSSMLAGAGLRPWGAAAALAAEGAAAHSGALLAGLLNTVDLQKAARLPALATSPQTPLAGAQAGGSCAHEPGLLPPAARSPAVVVSGQAVLLLTCSDACSQPQVQPAAEPPSAVLVEVRRLSSGMPAGPPFCQQQPGLEAAGAGPGQAVQLSLPGGSA